MENDKRELIDELIEESINNNMSEDNIKLNP